MKIGRRSMNDEIDVAPEFVCLSLNAWGTRGARSSAAAAALAQEENQ